MQSDLQNDALNERPSRPPIQETLASLGEMRESTNKTLIYGLSDLSDEEIIQLRSVWNGLSDTYRMDLLTALVETSENNADLDYMALAWLGLGDPSEETRKAAIELLWDNESLSLMEKLMAMAVHDPAVSVRAAAAAALGRFILLGEFEELPQREFAEGQRVLAELWTNPREDVEVRRRALESLANSSHDLVATAIAEAYDSEDQRLQISALFAMGRSCDERWSEIVLAELDNEDAEFRYEAARAAGELEIEEAIPALSRFVFDDDVDVRDVAIWSLGEIGGKEAVRILNLLANDAKLNRDRDLAEAIEDALAIAELGGSNLYMMRLDD